MTRIVATPLYFLCWLIPVAVAQTQPSSAPDLVGDWNGAIVAQGLNLKIVVHLKHDGAWSGTIDVPMQGAKGIPLRDFEITPEVVRFSMAGIPGNPRFDGKFDGAKITGAYTQGGNNCTFELQRGAGEIKLNRPQEPKPPFPYRAEEVKYANGSITLAGTLTIPAGKGPFPAAVLITGSGAQDRDESLLGHKPFAVIADHLSRHGVAVLRVDDRGVGGSSGVTKTATSADFATDVLAGVALLKTRPEIAPGKIGLIGHSEGGVVGPMAASQSGDVAFVIMLAGTGVNGKEVLIKQSALMLAAAGADQKAVAANSAAMEKVVSVLSTSEAGADRTARLREAIAELVVTDPTEKSADDKVQEVVDAQIKQFDTPWMIYFLSYEPAEALRKLKMPVLVLNGEKDLQVSPGQNLPAIEAALREAKNPDVTIKQLPGLNHLFQPAKTGSPSEYAEIETTIDPSVLDIVTDWINQRFAR